MSAADREKLREAERAAEQAALEEEMRKRRERVRAWQESRAKQQGLDTSVAPATADATNSNSVTASEPIAKEASAERDGEDDKKDAMEVEPASSSEQPKWSLEDEDDDEDAVEGGEVTANLTHSVQGSSEVFSEEVLAALPSVLASPSVKAGEEAEKESAFDRIVSSSKLALPPSSPAHLPPSSPAMSVLTAATAASSASASKSPAHRTNKPASASAQQSVSQSKPSEPMASQASDDDDDPLDAFMKSLLSPEEALLGEMSESESEAPAFKPTSAVATKTTNTNNSITSAPKSSSQKPSSTKPAKVSIGAINPSNTKKPQINPFGSNFVTYEDILAGNLGGVASDEQGEEFVSPTRGTTGATGRTHRAGWESDVPSSPLVVEDDIAREEREERERREFWEALKKAAPAALTPAAGPAGSKTERGVVISTLAQPGVTAVVNTVSLESEAPEGGKEPQPEFGRIFAGEGDVIEETEVEEKKKSALETLEEARKGKELKPVDHSTIEYIPIRKNLYIVPKALSRLTEEEVKEKREDLQIKVRGRLCPAPVDNWQQCGLSDRTLQTLEKYNIEAPFAIQKQAIPAIMCGRDVIAIAKTGSGKTLAFLLPLFRHIQDQPPLKSGEGPIGLIMAPARELALQISREAKKFAKPLGLSVACIYGGAGVAEQIAELKRGADIVVCTPGRMIDILCMQAGKMVSFKRVSYVVMDEADRMFDMGFEPQIKMIIQNVRPDRQTVLFSATFPKQIEKLAKAILRAPLEIVVGERSTVNKDITQIVEVHEEEDKFMRLLQLLGVWYERGSVLIFVDKQEKCDKLFHDLLKSGYPCLSLHGGHDQVDRDHTLHEFRQGIKTVLVATSAASRGLDIPEIVVVVNYHCPNHLEDYVHRVGRTGRAGRKGTAYTFISPNEEQYAPIMVKALEKAEQTPPQELVELATQFKEKVARGEAHWSASGFGGEGFTFDASEMNEAQKMASMQRKQWEIEQGIAQDKEDVDYVDDDDEDADAFVSPSISARGAAAVAVSSSSGTTVTTTADSSSSSSSGILAPDSAAFAALPPLEKAQMMVKYLASKNALPGTASVPIATQPVPVTATGAVDANAALLRARQLAQQLATKGVLPGSIDSAEGAAGALTTQTFSDEVEINDYPPQVHPLFLLFYHICYHITHSFVTIYSFIFMYFFLYRQDER